MSLKTDYKDAMFPGKRKYRMVQNEDGTVSFDDVTEYTQQGDRFGAKDINDTNTAVELKFDSDDVVDPMLANQTGFASDAKATGDALKSQNSKIEGVWEKIYPVGSIYMSTSSANPRILFGGSWEQIQGKFLLGAGGGYSAGSSGGEATHKLTVAEMPSHSHTVYYQHECDNGSGAGFGLQSYPNPGSLSSASAGGNQAHNNMPPYLSVYIWKRTA